MTALLNAMQSAQNMPASTGSTPVSYVATGGTAAAAPSALPGGTAPSSQVGSSGSVGSSANAAQRPVLTALSSLGSVDRPAAAGGLASAGNAGEASPAGAQSSATLGGQERSTLQQWQAGERAGLDALRNLVRERTASGQMSSGSGALAETLFKGTRNRDLFLQSANAPGASYGFKERLTGAIPEFKSQGLTQVNLSKAAMGVTRNAALDQTVDEVAQAEAALQQAETDLVFSMIQLNTSFSGVLLAESGAEVRREERESNPDDTDPYVAGLEDPEVLSANMSYVVSDSGYQQANDRYKTALAAYTAVAPPAAGG